MKYNFCAGPLAAIVEEMYEDLKPKIELSDKSRLESTKKDLSKIVAEMDQKGLSKILKEGIKITCCPNLLGRRIVVKYKGEIMYIQRDSSAEIKSYLLCYSSGVWEEVIQKISNKISYLDD